MPDPDDITEEGFGFFRGTWFIGRVTVEEAALAIAHERQLLEAIDCSASTPDEFELLARAAEYGDPDGLPNDLPSRFTASGLAELSMTDDIDPLGGLEIGVAGVTYSLSAVGCLTAASCRWHLDDRSWSDCPVVFFAAPTWRAEVIGELAASASCGLDADRDMLKIYASSIADMHRLGASILDARRRFRGIQNRHKAAHSPESLDVQQLELPDLDELDPPS